MNNAHSSNVSPDLLAHLYVDAARQNVSACESRLRNAQNVLREAQDELARARVNAELAGFTKAAQHALRWDSEDVHNRLNELRAQAGLSDPRE